MVDKVLALFIASQIETTLKSIFTWNEHGSFSLCIFYTFTITFDAGVQLRLYKSEFYVHISYSVYSCLTWSAIEDWSAIKGIS